MVETVGSRESPSPVRLFCGAGAVSSNVVGAPFAPWLGVPPSGETEPGSARGGPARRSVDWKLERRVPP
jgi:hypothetical protein